MTTTSPTVSADPYVRFSHFLARARFSPETFHLRIAHTPIPPTPPPPPPPNSNLSPCHSPSPLPSVDDVVERGIRATANLVIERATPLLSLPSVLLITPERVLSSSSILALLPLSSLLSLSCEDLLIFYLILHRRLGEQSPAFPYLDLLPSSYSSLEWWSEDEVQLLCSRAQREDSVGGGGGDNSAIRNPSSSIGSSDEADPLLFHRNECARIRRDCAHLNGLLSTQYPQLQRCHYDTSLATTAGSLPLTPQRGSPPPAGHPLCCCSSQTPPPHSRFRCLISVAEYQWAQSTVASRSCYWPSEAGESSKSSSPSLPPRSLRCCLIPFLDLLNHSSFVSSTCAYDSSSQEYHLNVRDRHPTSHEGEGLRVTAGDEVVICYGELSNWELLTRYGFVLADSQDERVDISRQQLEGFIAQHCRKERNRGGPPPRLSTWAVSTAEAASPTSDSMPCLGSFSTPSPIHCCCTRAVLPSSLTASPRPSSLPLLPPLPSFSEKHSTLLALLGMYDIPPSFSLSCCQPHWPLLTFIKVRTVFIGVDGGSGVDRQQMQSLAAMMSEDGDEEGIRRGWIDGDHERRGRDLLIALARWMEGRMGGERSLETEVEKLDWLMRHKVEVERALGEENERVSWRSRVLSAQFRVSRRRMLLGFINYEQRTLQAMR